MKVVHKFALPVDRNVTLAMPSGAEIIHVGCQVEPDVVYLWAVVDKHTPDSIQEAEQGFGDRSFTVVGTGHPMPPDFTAGDHVGTAIWNHGQLVWHVFERLPF